MVDEVKTGTEVNRLPFPVVSPPSSRGSLSLCFFVANPAHFLHFCEFKNNFCEFEKPVLIFIYKFDHD